MAIAEIVSRLSLRTTHVVKALAILRVSGPGLSWSAEGAAAGLAPSAFPKVSESCIPRQDLEAEN